MSVWVLLCLLLLILPVAIQSDTDSSAEDIYQEIKICQDQLAATKAELESVKKEYKAKGTCDTNDSIMSIVRAIQLNLSITTEIVHGLVTETISKLKKETKDLRREFETLTETQLTSIKNAVLKNMESLHTADGKLTRLEDNQQVLSNYQETLAEKLDKHLDSYKEDITNAVKNVEQCQSGNFKTSKTKDVFPYTANVAFRGAFSQPPVVTIGGTYFDFAHSANLRVDFALNQVTNTHFKVIINVWANTIAYGVGFHWMACLK